MILEPEHETENASAVRNLTPEAEGEAGAGKAETEARKSTINRWEDNQRRTLGIGR